MLTAIKGLKSGKGEGKDNIPAEMIKVLEGKALDEVVLSCQQIYCVGKWPEVFLRSVLFPLEKKPGTRKCEEHRTIGLITHASKI